MKKPKLVSLYCSIGVASVLISPSMFASYSVLGTGTVVVDTAGFPPDDAGPYQAVLNYSSGLKPVSSSFETFCIGTDVNFYPGQQYSYEISTTVQPQDAAEGGPGFVTWGTAYLYSQFLAHPNIFAGGTGNNDENDGLQLAMWELQGQDLGGLTYNAYQGQTPAITAWATTFLTDASTAAALHGISDTINANGAFGVYALNLTTAPGTYASGSYGQPLLVEVVPEPSTVIAGAMMLAPFGMSVRRFLRKPTQSPVA